MPQQVLDEKSGVVHNFPDEATPEQIQAAMAESGRPEPGAFAQDVITRAAKDFGAGVTGVIKGVQGIAGMPGDLDAFLVKKGMQPLITGGKFPTTEQIGDFFSKLNGGQGLVEPSTPEGKIIQPIAQGAASMMSGNPLVMAVGGLGGGAGEFASRMLDTGTGEGNSMARSLGNLAVLAPFAAASAFRPGNVRALGPVLDTLGDTKTQVLAAIDRAMHGSDVAASSLSMPHTSLWAQIPELAPEVKDLRGTLAGRPLNEQVRTEAEALNREITPRRLANLPPQWNKDFGWTDPWSSLENLASSHAATAAERSSNLFKDLKDNIVGKAIGLINPLDWPRKGGEAISEAVARANVSDLAKSLAGPHAAQALKSIVNYSPATNFAQMLAKSIMRLQGMAGPAQPPLRIDITGGNQPQ